MIPKVSRKTDQNRLIKALSNRNPDSIPLIELGIHPIIKEKLLGRPVNDMKDEIEFMRKYGYDFVKIQPKITFEVGGRKLKNAQVSNAVTSPDRTWAPEHTGIISDMRAFEEHAWPNLNEIDYSKFEEAEKILPDDMCIIGQYGDIFTMAWELMGFENFAVATYTDIELVEAIMNKLGEIVFNMFENMAEMNFVKVLWYSDDIAYNSGLMLQPDFFRTYLFPYIRKIGDLCKERDIPFIYHSDGVLYDLLEDLIECGVTSLHPIEPKSMDISELRNLYGGRLSLCGGIDLDILSRGSKKEIEILVLEFIEKVGRSGAWSAGSSNSIPEYVNVENYIAMQETVIKNGDL